MGETYQESSLQTGGGGVGLTLHTLGGGIWAEEVKKQTVLISFSSSPSHPSLRLPKFTALPLISIAALLLHSVNKNPVVSEPGPYRRGLWKGQRGLLEVAENADVCKLLAVAVGAEAQQEGPLQGHEAPHAGQVQALWVGQGLFACDGHTEEGDKGNNGQQGEENPDEEEELEALQPGSPVVLQVHDMRDKGPESEYTW